MRSDSPLSALLNLSLNVKGPISSSSVKSSFPKHPLPILPFVEFPYISLPVSRNSKTHLKSLSILISYVYEFFALLLNSLYSFSIHTLVLYFPLPCYHLSFYIYVPMFQPILSYFPYFSVYHVCVFSISKLIT